MVLLRHYLSQYRMPPVLLHPQCCTDNPHNATSNNFTYKSIPYRVEQEENSRLVLVVNELESDIAALRVPTLDEQFMPPVVVRSEHDFQTEVTNRLLVPYVRKAITITRPSTDEQEGGWAFDGNTWPGNRSGYGKPGVAFVYWFGVYSADDDITIRFPLEIKLSSMWDSKWRTSNSRRLNQQYRQVLSQIHYYMDVYDCRYGGILTDKGSVIVERLEKPRDDGSAYGKIKVHKLIRWGRCHDGLATLDDLVTKPAVALALWRMSTRNDRKLRGHTEDQYQSHMDNIEVGSSEEASEYDPMEEDD